MLGYANSIRTIDGGTHIDGLKASLTRTINNLAKKSKTIKVIMYRLLFLRFLANAPCCLSYTQLVMILNHFIGGLFLNWYCGLLKSLKLTSESYLSNQ